LTAINVCVGNHGPTLATWAHRTYKVNIFIKHLPQSWGRNLWDRYVLLSVCAIICNLFACCQCGLIRHATLTAEPVALASLHSSPIVLMAVIGRSTDGPLSLWGLHSGAQLLGRPGVRTPQLGHRRPVRLAPIRREMRYRGGSAVREFPVEVTVIFVSFGIGLHCMHSAY